MRIRYDLFPRYYFARFPSPWVLLPCRHRRVNNLYSSHFMNTQPSQHSLIICQNI